MIGKIICDLAPGADNDRNSEGAFIRLKNGDLMFAYSRYRGGGSADHCAADIFAIISKDDGESFGAPFKLLSCEEVGADNIMSVSFMRLKTGALGMFYVRKQNEKKLCIPHLAISNDEGKSWDRHIRCIEKDGYYVLNNDRVIALPSGRYLMPVARHVLGDGPMGAISGDILIFASDDDGESWYQISNDIKSPYDDIVRKEYTNDTYLYEPGLVLLDDGRIWCFIRTGFGRQYECFSYDNGKSWSKPMPSPFTTPHSPMSVKKLRDGRLFTVRNPIPYYQGRKLVVEGAWLTARDPLVFLILEKDGKFINDDFTVIEDDKRGGYCYCAIYVTEKGDVFLGYCAGRVEDRACLNRIRIRKIYRAELE